MTLKPIVPRKALNLSFLRVKPHREEIEKFKLHLTYLLDQIEEKESEEFHKNIISKFFFTTYYHPDYYINTKGRNDLVIHNGKDAKSSVGVIIETKKPTNKSEMLHLDSLNAKAFHELVLYYLRERITGNNLEIKHLVVTNIYEWFIFDAQLFEKAFAQDAHVVKQFIEFEEKRLSGTNTDFFYKKIAEPAVERLINGTSKAGKDIDYTYFAITDFDRILRNDSKLDDNKLISLFKLLSPEHLLKLPFKNDSNSLDKGFYTELLHIIGLSEVKDGGKKLIGRREAAKREEGSFLENTINQLDALGKIDRLNKPAAYGATLDQRYFNVSLELIIIWINRILFLKLLEAQLLTYNRGDKGYSFLNCSVIKNFDDLNSLFFQVLAKKTETRDSSIKHVFDKVPYLNSSLFEPTDLEHNCFFISQLQDKKELSILPSTVLKDSKGKKRVGKLSAMEYLFSFLDAYDFSSEGSEEIQEENKTLINASVLGLIFEKINGYKDGSFFTPGFITMYMCRETIRRAVIQKFNDVKKWNCSTLNEVHDNIQDRIEANEIINSLKICDPAVGSGHFLVSALNEIIAIKSDLKILLDREGKRLRDYNIAVVNDELVVTDEEGHLLDYYPKNKESQRVQEALFHEKQAVIENCLFGVDINQNSVKICRLRLWIELLKNAYYRPETSYTELETLPNIDINIKCGNSLISRFSLDVDLKQALKKSKITIKSYKQAVQSYRHATSKEQKRDLEQLIDSIKSNFRTEISNNDPKIRKLSSRRGELDNLLNQHQLFDLSQAEKKERTRIANELQQEIQDLSEEIEQIRNNKIFEGAFEWRIEFPEVLNDDGKFLGFDVVIANPPYGVTFSELEKQFFRKNYSYSTEGKMESYKLFYELSFRVIRLGYYQAFIAPNTFLYNVQSKPLRSHIITTTTILNGIELRKNIFEDAPDVVTVIMLLKTVITPEYRIAAKVAYPDLKYSNIDNDDWMIDQMIPIKVLECDEERKINLRRDFRLDDLIERMNTCPRLGAAFYLKQGTKPYGDKDAKDAHVLGKKKLDDNWGPAINGRNISPFHIHFDNDFVKRSDELHSCLPKDIVESPKIYFQRMRKISLYPRVVAAYDDKGIHGLYTCSVIYPMETTTISLKYILGLLNSQLINIWYKNYDTDIEIKLTSVKKIPIPLADKLDEDQIIDIVDQMIQKKENEPKSDTKELQSLLDKLVYKIFRLSEKEVEMIEAL